MERQGDYKCKKVGMAGMKLRWQHGMGNIIAKKDILIIEKKIHFV